MPCLRVRDSILPRKNPRVSLSKYHSGFMDKMILPKHSKFNALHISAGTSNMYGGFIALHIGTTSDIIIDFHVLKVIFQSTIFCQRFHYSSQLCNSLPVIIHLLAYRLFMPSWKSVKKNLRKQLISS